MNAMSKIDPVPNEDDLKLAEDMATGILSGQREGFIRGASIALAKGRVIRHIKDTQLDYCDALLARCGKALAAAEYELGGGTVKDAVIACLSDLKAGGLDPQTTSPFHTQRLRRLLELATSGMEAKVEAPIAKPDTSRFRKMVESNDWGHRYMEFESDPPRGTASASRAVVPCGYQVSALMVDGSVQVHDVLHVEYREEVYDHGHRYDVKGEVVMVIRREGGEVVQSSPNGMMMDPSEWRLKSP